MKCTFLIFVIFFFSTSLVAGEFPPDCPEPQEDPEAAAAEAGKWFQTGIEHAAAEAFEAAGQAFKCSDRLVPHPATILNIANAAEHAGDTDGVEAAYTEFLRRYPDDSRVETVLAALEEMRPGAGAAFRKNEGGKAAPAKSATNDSGTAVAQRNEAAASIGPPEEAKLSARDREIKEGDNTKLLRKVRVMRATGFSLLSVGAATVIAGAVTGAIALSYDRDLAEACGDEKCGEAQWNKLDAMEGLATATTVLLAVGGTMTVIGAVIPIAAKRAMRKKESAVSATVTPFAGAGSFSVGIQGAF